MRYCAGEAHWACPIAIAIFKILLTWITLSLTFCVPHAGLTNCNIPKKTQHHPLPDSLQWKADHSFAQIIDNERVGLCILEFRIEIQDELIESSFALDGFFQRTRITTLI